jgi:hypothetical protein
MAEAITVDLKGLEEALRNFQDQIPFASAKALTELAKRVQQKQKDAIATVFDNPNAFTKNSTFYKSASKTDLESKVGFKDTGYYGGQGGHYLTAQIIGGARETKRLERFLTGKGWLKNGELIVPSRDVRKDSYGNIQRKVLEDMIFGLQQGYNRRFEYNYFVPPRNHPKLAPGVWRSEWSTGIIIPIVLFIDRTQYAQKYNFFDIATQTVTDEFQQISADAVQLALDTLR